ncbi:PKD domain-containing protein [Candidatus Bipolaricaulota bacterium]
MHTPKARFLLLVGFLALICVAIILPGCARFDGIVDFTASPTSGKKPLSVQFTPVVEGSVRKYVWNFGDGQTSTERSPEHTYFDAGAYTVILMVEPRRGEPTSVLKEDYITVTASGFGSSPSQLVVQDDDITIGASTSVHGFVDQRGDTVYVLDVLENDVEGADGLWIIAVGFSESDFEYFYFQECSRLNLMFGDVMINRDGTAIEYFPYSSSYDDQAYPFDHLPRTAKQRPWQRCASCAYGMILLYGMMDSRSSDRPMCPRS